MGKLQRPKSKGEEPLFEVPEEVTVALAEIAGNAKHHLLALSAAVGLAVVKEIFEHEVTQIVGPKGKHIEQRTASRHGHESRRITLGGRRTEASKPRVRSTGGKEIELESFRQFSSRDQLDEYTLGAILAGVSTRRYQGVLEPVGVDGSATKRSSVSRRLIQGTSAKLAELFSRDLSKLDLVAMFIDGKNVGGHTLVLALGVDSKGKKHPLGLWIGTTENKAVCGALIDELIDRGLDTDTAMLFVIDGGKAIRAAIVDRFGELALIQRCRKHKKTNVTDHLPISERGFVGRKMEAAWKLDDPKQAETELRSIAKSLKLKHPGAEASLLEGLEETLTVNRLGLKPSLVRTFKSTNPIESMISISRTVSRNVKRWRSGEMARRWTAAAMLEAEKQFRRVNGYKDIGKLKKAIARHEEVVRSKNRAA